MPNLVELVESEKQLPGTTFTHEKSGLMQVNSNFPRMEGISFIGWLNSYSGGGRVLEIGGGKEQSTAREIVRKYPEILFFALEPRSLTDNAKQELEKVTNYRLFGQGISRIDNVFAEVRFNIIFAHHVFEHLPNPFIAMAKVCKLLDKGGIFFCNDIPASIGFPEEFAVALRARRARVEYDSAMYKTENRLLRAGNIRASFAIQVNEGLLFPPIKEGEHLVDCEGGRLAVRHCFIGGNET